MYVYGDDRQDGATVFACFPLCFESVNSLRCCAWFVLASCFNSPSPTSASPSSYYLGLVSRFLSGSHALVGSGHILQWRFRHSYSQSMLLPVLSCWLTIPDSFGTRRPVLSSSYTCFVVAVLTHSHLCLELPLNCWPDLRKLALKR